MENFNPAPPPSHHQPRKNRVGRVLILILVLLLVVAIASAGFLFVKYRAALDRANNPTQVLNEQSQDLRQELANLILIDEQVDPTIATVIDIEALKAENPEFYKNGRDGQIIFIYPTRVILYDKDEKKIINVAPIIVNPDSSQK